MEYQNHEMTFKTDELATILTLVLQVLAEEKPEEEFAPLIKCLVSIAEKVSLEMGFSPISIPDPVHIA